ncbi:MAG: hypothetical protein ACKOUM_11925 [Sphingopyxis sp.]
MADFAVESATILSARIRRAREVEAARAANVPPHLVRLYVEADVETVIFGSDPVARRISYLVDLPRTAQGRAPRVKKQHVLLFARRLSAVDQLQLVQPSAQRLWSAGDEATARSIARELARGAPPPAITGVAQAFHVPGTVEGESETQIFLSTATAQMVSLTILRRPAQAPRWAAAFGEIVDESAAIPAPRTIAWYRLACGLPGRLPGAAVAGLASADAAIAAADYAMVVRAVGPCDRSAPATP